MEMASLVQRIFEKAARNMVALNASFELTRRCNAFCPHCYCARQTGGSELGTREACRALSKLADLGCMFLTLTGGEILLRADALEIAREARRLGFILRLKTNGLLLDESAAQEMARLSPEAVHMSLYGADSATHDSFTGVPGSFERLTAAAKALRARGVPVLLAATFTAHNFRQCARMYELAGSLGAALRGSPSISRTRAGDERPLKAAIRNVEDIAWLLEAKLRAAPPPESALGRLTGRAMPLSDYNLCSAGFTNLRVDPSGNVHPCLLIERPLGNILDDDLHAIWRQHEYLEHLRSLRRSDCEVCRECELEVLCRRCPAESLHEHGSLTAPSSAACLVARAWKMVLGEDPIGKIRSVSAVALPRLESCPE